MDEITETYQHLVDEIKAVKTEFIFQSRWALVEGYWNIGKLIREQFTGNELTKQLQDLGVDTGVSSTTLWYSLQTFDKYPRLDTLPEGKNISWNKLITTYLPNRIEEKKTIPKPMLKQCLNCGKWKMVGDNICECH